MIVENIDPICLSNFDVEIVPHIDVNCCYSDPVNGYLDIACVEQYQENLESTIGPEWDYVGMFYKETLSAEAQKRISQRRRILNLREKQALNLWDSLKQDVIDARIEREKQEAKRLHEEKLAAAERKKELARKRVEEANKQIALAEAEYAEQSRIERDMKKSEYGKSILKNFNGDCPKFTVPVPLQLCKSANKFFQETFFCLKDTDLDSYLKSLKAAVQSLNVLRADFELPAMEITDFLSWYPTEYSDILYNTVYSNHDVPANMFKSTARLRKEYIYSGSSGEYWYEPTNSSQGRALAQQLDNIIADFAKLGSAQNYLLDQLGAALPKIDWHDSKGKRIRRTKIRIVIEYKNDSLEYRFITYLPEWLSIKDCFNVKEL